MFNIAVFASGGGSNAEKIIQYFENHTQISVSLIVCNKEGAGVLRIAEKYHVPTLQVNRTSFYKMDELIRQLKNMKIDFIILAGFLWLIPEELIMAYPDKILNIHPSLLPKYGGKGMYGHHVHEAVKANNECESGMTIHLVNKRFDEGNILYQKSCAISPEMTANEIAISVLQLEHRYYPEVIEKYIIHKVVAL